jgi:hypothetical protein
MGGLEIGAYLAPQAAAMTTFWRLTSSFVPFVSDKDNGISDSAAHGTKLAPDFAGELVDVIGGVGIDDGGGWVAAHAVNASSDISSGSLLKDRIFGLKACIGRFGVA